MPDSRHADTFPARTSARSPTRSASQGDVDMSKTESNVATATAAPDTGQALEIKIRAPGRRTPSRSSGGPRVTRRFAPPTCGRSRSDADDFGMMSYDPAFMNTASCRARSPSSTATRGSCATAATRSSSSPRRRRFLEVAWLLRHGELPTQDAVRQLGARHHVPHVRAREHQDVPRGLPLRRAPDVDAVQRRRGALGVLPGGARTSTTRASATSRSSACSRSCRRSRRSAIAT